MVDDTSDNGEQPPRRGSPPLSCSVSFCPICMAVTTIGEARPELVQHLMLAGREILLAARAVIDARLQDIDGEEERPARIKRITIE